MEKEADDFTKQLAEVLLRPDGTKFGAAAPAAIGGKILGLYFSASWCPPCHAFTPILAAWYKTLKGKRDDVEIVFVSSDKSLEEFQAYRSQMPWLSIDYVARDLKGALGQAFNVTGIPTLVFLDKDGSVITLEGRKKVMSDPDGFPWTKAGPAAVPGQVGLYENVASTLDGRKSSALNVDGKADLAALLSEGGSVLSSDGDDQLILNLQFNAPIKLHRLERRVFHKSFPHCILLCSFRITAKVSNLVVIFFPFFSLFRTPPLRPSACCFSSIAVWALKTQICLRHRPSRSTPTTPTPCQ